MSESKSSVRKKKYRFFFHYRKQTAALTIHFRNQCIPVNNIICRVPCETKWHKRQPHLTMQGYATEVELLKHRDGSTVGIIE